MLFISLVPILLILALMLGWRWSAARAGAAGYLSALLAAVLFFGAGPFLLAFAHARALLLAMDVLLIIWAAFLLYRVVDEAGAIRTIGLALPHLTNDPGMQAVIIGWVFATFLQGVGGFGVPVAVIAPLLAGLGFTPMAAVVIPSIGHGWAVTFGSLGSSFQALVAATGLPAETLAPAAALFLGAAALMTGCMVVHAACGWVSLRRLFIPVVLIGVVMAAVQYLVATSRLWHIAAFAGGMAGLLASFPLAHRFRGSQDGPKQPFRARDLAVALAGYALLVLVILLVQFIAPLRQFLSQVALQLPFPETQTNLGYITPASMSRRIPIFAHAGALLTYASILAYLVYRSAGLYQPGAARRILRGVAARVISPSLSILSMVSMAVIMEQTGMTSSIARGLAGGVGAAYPLVAPWIGAVGALMTGSNTNSNVVFGMLQLLTAEMLHYPPAIILAGQTAGAALASVIAPAKMVVGASTAGMAGREGEVMRAMLGYTILLVALISLLTLAAVWFL